MPLHFVGLGLTPEDITLRAVNIIKKCQKVFLDTYTSILVSYQQMTDLVASVLQRHDLVQADRVLVEQNAEQIIEPAKTEDIAFLVVGDPMCATTHSDLYLRAVKAGVRVEILHNASIINAVAASGVSIYNVGRAISIPFFEPKWKPASFLDKVLQNYRNGMHSLMLLDIKTHELDIKAYMKGVEVYCSPRYMTCAVACQQIIEVLENQEGREDFASVQKDAEECGFSADARCVACMRVGTPEQRFIYCSIREMSRLHSQMGDPLHSLLILSEQILDMEREMFELWAIKQ